MKVPNLAKKRHSIRLYVMMEIVGIGLITAVAAVAFALATAKSYYAAVRSELEGQVHGDMVETYFGMRSGAYGESFIETAQGYVNQFRTQSGVQVLVLNSSGQAIASSSDLEAALAASSGPAPDYLEAVRAADKMGAWFGRAMGGNVYAFTYILKFPGLDNYAVRYLMPLRETNTQIAGIWLFIALVWLAFNSLVFMFGRLTIRWIGDPISRISVATTKIADGNYAVRIPLPKAHNELYDLSADINHMAEKVSFAEQTKLDFISTISHELRTPLTAINGWGETLQQTGDADRDLVYRGLSVMTEESARLTKLVEELLDFSRMQSKRMVLQKEPIDVLAELDDVTFLFRERAARTGVALASQTLELPAPMLGDPARIRQVFFNLLDNAFKHTPQGGCVTVSTHFMNADGSHVTDELHVVIQDTGSGVSQKDLPHITEKFFKSSTNTKGSGIGLAVVEELLKAHGCSLRFESKPGQGLTVHIVFPLMGKTMVAGALGGEAISQ